MHGRCIRYPDQARLAPTRKRSSRLLTFEKKAREVDTFDCVVHMAAVHKVCRPSDLVPLTPPSSPPPRVRRRAWEKIETEAEQLVAAARVTRADYHAPFRARLYPVAPSSDGDSDGKRAALGGQRGDEDVRDNWDDSSEEEEEDNQEEEEEEEEEGLAGEFPHEDLSPADAASGGAGGEYENESDVTTGEEEDACLEAVVAGDGIFGTPGGDGSAEFPVLEGLSVRALDTESRGSGQEDEEEEEEENAGGGAGVGVASTAGKAPPAAVRRQSKWANSVLKGRLSRPSDGRATTVEQEAKERRERVESLR